ncbi:hypothetical protein BP5796_05933 [Coleophoma crateriformis]|uniref:Restriction of telomere capping protein 4 n=1 Tax=Coleophoma crateriformis TaxID=565419 RepID=A0A3D8RW97_9HELO|nr:hypothetical protein BP5796_05933 [Coleophoma crateriformis]
MATRERQNVYQGLNLTGRSNFNAPFKPPRPAMPQSRNASNSSLVETEPGLINPIEDIHAPPISSSDEDDCSANIKHTHFGSRAKSREETASSKPTSRSTTTAMTKKRNAGSIAKPPRPGRAQESRTPLGWTPGARHLKNKIPTYGKSKKLKAGQSFLTSRKPLQGNGSDGEDSVELESPRPAKLPVIAKNKTSRKRSISSSPRKELIDFSDIDDTPEKTKYGTPEAGLGWVDPAGICDSISPEPNRRLKDIASPLSNSTFIRPDSLSDDSSDLDRILSPADVDVKSTPLRRKSSVKSGFGEKIQRHSTKKRRKETREEDSEDEVQPAFVVPEGSDIAETSFDFKPIDFGEDDSLLNHVPDIAKAMAQEDGYGELLKGLDGAARRSSFLAERDANCTTISGIVCPVCNEPVDEDDLKAWIEKTGKKNLDFTQQTKFCRSHQKKSAKTKWQSKGYPEINWDELDSRVSKQHTLIKVLIRGGPCYYRTALDRAVKSGKHRTLKEMSSGLVPGYYGSRGLRVMQENIMKNFSALLKERAMKDRLISARGVPSFVQAVLVLEVACVLIMEDMKIEEEEARTVLKDSIRLGELVNDEAKEFVRKRASTDDELSD